MNFNQDDGSEKDEKYCKKVAQTPAEFLLQPYANWFNPSNWVNDDVITPVPHREQVPCRFDRAIIPKESAPKATIIIIIQSVFYIRNSAIRNFRLKMG